MIEALSIQHFQAHAKQKYKLSQVTTFTGPSDSGKSSILRALGWLSFNRPRGTDFIREGGVCSVAAKVDGKVVGRRRGKSVNEYRLGKESFKAIGSDVPEQIADLLCLDREINFQGQHDVPFWVGLSSAEVARRLNKVADLESIDDTLSKLAAKTREEAGREKVLVELLVGVEQELEELDGVEELDQMLASVEESEAVVSSKRHDKEGLKDLLRCLKNTERAAGIHHIMYVSGKDMCRKLKRLEDRSKDVDDLSRLLQRVEECSFTSSPPCFETADAALSAAAAARDRYNGLMDAVERTHKHLDAVELHRENAAKGEKWLKDNVSVCSECGREL